MNKFFIKIKKKYDSTSKSILGDAFPCDRDQVLVPVTLQGATTNFTHILLTKVKTFTPGTRFPGFAGGFFVPFPVYLSLPPFDP